jgi:hypothetical protein
VNPNLETWFIAAAQAATARPTTRQPAPVRVPRAQPARWPAAVRALLARAVRLAPRRQAGTRGAFVDTA